MSGDISTNFIQEVYPNGFQGTIGLKCINVKFIFIGRKLDKRSTEILIGAACFIHIKRINAAPAFSNQHRLVYKYMCLNF